MRFYEFFKFFNVWFNLTLYGLNLTYANSDVS